MFFQELIFFTNFCSLSIHNNDVFCINDNNFPCWINGKIRVGEVCPVEGEVRIVSELLGYLQ